MIAEILHSGFDGLRLTIETDIPPPFRDRLHAAKAEAVETHHETILTFDDVRLAVRRSGGMAFSAQAGDMGAEWYFLDPETRPANNPGITVDFRAFLLATGGLKAAQSHLETCMQAFGIAYGENQLRVTRADFAIDFLAPWFESDRTHLALRSNGMKISRASYFHDVTTPAVPTYANARLSNVGRPEHILCNSLRRGGGHILRRH